MGLSFEVIIKLWRERSRTATGGKQQSRVMLPLFKVFSMIIRVFSRPVVNHIKSIHKSNFKNVTGVSRYLVMLGNKYHRMEVAINKRLMNVKTDTDMFVKPLSPEIALEKGIEFFYEIVIYSLVLGLSVFELYKAQVSADEKKQKEEARISTLEKSLDDTKLQLATFTAQSQTSHQEMSKNVQLILERLTAANEAQAKQDALNHEVLQSIHSLRTMQAGMQDFIVKFSKKADE